MLPFSKTTPPPSSDRLHLQPLEAADLCFLHQRLKNPPGGGCWYGTPYHGLDALLALHEQHRFDPQQRHYLLAGAPTGSKGWDNRRGLCSLVALDPIHRRAELRLELLQDEAELWAEALPLARALAFDEVNLHRLELQRPPAANPSTELLQRLGFQREGVRRAAYYRAGRYEDGELFALLAPDYYGP